MKKCNGNCIETHGQHSGEVVSVLVKDKDFNSRKFNFDYCENAIEEDERRGFEVIIIDESEVTRLTAKSEWEPLDRDELDYINASF